MRKLCELIKELAEEFDAKEEVEIGRVEAQISGELVDYRLKNGLTQEDLARKLKVSQERLSKIESGEANFQIATLARYASRLGGKLDIRLGIAPLVEETGKVFEISTVVSFSRQNLCVPEEQQGSSYLTVTQPIMDQTDQGSFAYAEG